MLILFSFDDVSESVQSEFKIDSNFETTAWSLPFFLSSNKPSSPGGHQIPLWVLVSTKLLQDYAAFQSAPPFSICCWWWCIRVSLPAWTISASIIRPSTRPAVINQHIRPLSAFSKPWNPDELDVLICWSVFFGWEKLSLQEAKGRL